MFWINLSRYVAVILYESIYRIKLPSCEPYKWILSSLNLETYVKPKIPRHNLFSCSNSPILDSNRTVLLLCPPPPLHPKLGLTNLIVNGLFTWNPNLEEQIADQLGIARKEYYGKSFEGRQCSKLLSCSASLTAVVPPLVECLEAFHRVVVGVFGQIVDPETKGNKQTHSGKRSWEPSEHKIPGWHQKYICLSIMYQNMWAVPQLHLDILLSRRWRASIIFLIFSTTDSKWIERTPPSFENVYWMLYYIITRVIYK